jgi:hypothetical protein
VDWILYGPKSTDTPDSIIPRLVAVIDVRTKDFSSDHFPVVGLFEVSQSQPKVAINS